MASSISGFKMNKLTNQNKENKRMEKLLSGRNKGIGWNLSESQLNKISSSGMKQFPPGGLYDVDMKVSDWKSEQKAKFITSSKVTKSTSIGEKNNKRNKSLEMDKVLTDDIENIDPQESENKNKYQWPQSHEITKTIKATDHNPILTDPFSVNENWHSEYESTYAALRKKQKDIQSSITGVPSINNEDNTSSTSVNKNHKSNSEYKQNFAWPEITNISTKVTFPDSKRVMTMSINPLDRDPSLWKSEYENQCNTLRNKQQELLNSLDSTIPAGIISPNNFHPPSYFVWEGGVEEEKPIINKPKFELLDDNRSSEYKENFSKKIPETNPIIDRSSLNLFSGEIVDSIVSEYDERFQFLPNNETIQLPPNEHDTSNTPSQFAWSLVEEPVTRKPIVTFQNNSNKSDIISEYDRNFANLSTVSSDKYEKATMSPIHYKKTDPICNSEDNVTEWKSEYDGKYLASQRSMQNNNNNNGGGEFVAGLKTEYGSHSPSFFAWKSEPPSEPIGIICH